MQPLGSLPGASRCSQGDILFLYMGRARIAVGEIVVFNIVGRRGGRAPRAARPAHVRRREIPIVHRVLSVHDRADGPQQDVLTKGDNNFGDDKARRSLRREAP